MIRNTREDAQISSANSKTAVSTTRAILRMWSSLKYAYSFGYLVVAVIPIDAP